LLDSPVQNAFQTASIWLRISPVIMGCDAPKTASAAVENQGVVIKKRYWAMH
jgi:hypothetical protein